MAGKFYPTSSMRVHLEIAAGREYSVPFALANGQQNHPQITQITQIKSNVSLNIFDFSVE
jgi:hypothetical protein